MTKNRSQKVHGVIDNGIACNRKNSCISGWSYTFRDHDLRVITCKKCKKAMQKRRKELKKILK